VEEAQTTSPSKVQDALQILRQALPTGAATVQVEALEAEWKKSQEHTKTLAAKGQKQEDESKQQAPSHEVLRRLHQKKERHEEQVCKAQRRVDYYEEQLGKVQAKLKECQDHLANRQEALLQSERDMAEAELKHRMAHPVGQLARLPELCDAHKLMSATQWLAEFAAQASEAKEERFTGPRLKELRDTVNTLIRVAQPFQQLILTGSSSDEEEEQDVEMDEKDASARRSNGREDEEEDEDGRSLADGGTGASTPKVPEGREAAVPVSSDSDPERAAKTAKKGHGTETKGTAELGPLATSFHLRHKLAAVPQLVRPRRGREGSSQRSRSPVPSYRSPNEELSGGEEEQER
jgi:hypothetical protein